MSLIREGPGLIASAEGFASITLVSADGSTEAEFVPEANMLCCSFSYRGDELLDQGAGVGAYAEQAAAMGIPLLHPSANRLSGFEYRAAGKSVTLSSEDPRIPQDPAGLPIQGVLPDLLHWDVEDTVAVDVIVARLRWGSEDLLALFPFANELGVRASVGSGGADDRDGPGCVDARPRPGLVWLSPRHSCSRRRP